MLQMKHIIHKLPTDQQITNHARPNLVPFNCLVSTAMRRAVISSAAVPIRWAVENIDLRDLKAIQICTKLGEDVKALCP